MIHHTSITAELLTLAGGTVTRGHHLKLSKQQSSLDIRENSFIMRVVNPWNSLSEEVISAPSIVSFEARLDKAWQYQPMKNNFKEDLRL
jgi:hypothetical protein